NACAGPPPYGESSGQRCHCVHDAGRQAGAQGAGCAPIPEPEDLPCGSYCALPGSLPGQWRGRTRAVDGPNAGAEKKLAAALRAWSCAVFWRGPPPRRRFVKCLSHVWMGEAFSFLRRKTDRQAKGANLMKCRKVGASLAALALALQLAGCGGQVPTSGPAPDAASAPSAAAGEPAGSYPVTITNRSEEHTSELQSRFDLVCRLLLEKIN